jgi:hypothetical protein
VIQARECLPRSTVASDAPVDLGSEREPSLGMEDPRTPARMRSDLSRRPLGKAVRKTAVTRMDVVLLSDGPPVRPEPCCTPTNVAVPLSIRFPPLTIGMGVVLVFLEGQYLRTKKPIFERAAKFWTKIFALNFAIGVASGIVMEFQFGTNWATYSRFVGDVFGSALAAEGIFAFFLESGFLAVLVFGWDRVSPKMHFFSTLMVASDRSSRRSGSSLPTVGSRHRPATTWSRSCATANRC